MRRHRARDADRRARRARGASASPDGRFCLTYADGVADIDLGAAPGVPRAIRRRSATVTVVQPRSQWGIAVLDRRRPRVAASTRSRGSTTGSTAGSSASSRRSSTTSSRRACSSASRSRASPPTGELGAFRHHGFWDCMDTYKDAVDAQRPLGIRRGALAGLGLRPGAALCRELVAGHRRPRASSGPGSRRRCSSAGIGSSRSITTIRTGRDRRWTCSGIAGDVADVEGDLGDADLLVELVSEHAVDSVFHLAAETIVGTVAASPVRAFETQRPRHVERARGLPHGGRRAGRRRLLRQGLRRPRRASLPRGLRRFSRPRRTRRRRPRPT